MYELIPITPHCSYIQSPAKIGLVEVGEGEVCLIDSGNDKDAGRRVRKVLVANGWKLRAIDQHPFQRRPHRPATNTSSARPAAPSTPPASTAPSPVTPSGARPTCTAVSRQGSAA